MLQMDCEVYSTTKLDTTIPDSLSYQVINTFCMFNKFERISKTSMRYMYEGEYGSQIDTAIKTSGAQHFLQRVKEYDTSKNFFDSSDFVFLKEQINKPQLLVFIHKRIKNTRVKKEQYFIPMTYAVSIPIFSKDLKTAIICANYWGMSRTHLYHLNPMTKAWELLDQLWQDGS